MTRATEILRHAGEYVALRATAWPQRLAILEERRRIDLFQRARPYIAPDLAQAIHAFRGLCPILDSDACRHDMRAAEGREVELVRAWLDASDINDETQNAWFQHAQDRHGITATEDGWFTDDTFFCGLHEVWYSRRAQANYPINAVTMRARLE